MKLHNEMSGQIEVLKGELEQCKEKISLLEKDSEIIKMERKTVQLPQQQQAVQPVVQKLDLQ